MNIRVSHNSYYDAALPVSLYLSSLTLLLNPAIANAGLDTSKNRERLQITEYLCRIIIIIIIIICG